MDVAIRRPWRLSSGRAPWLVAYALVVAAAIAASTAIVNVSGIQPRPNEYNLTAWEARTFANKWLYGLGRLFRGARGTGQQDRDLSAFFGAIDQVDALERQSGPDAEKQLALATSQRDALENKAEASIEGRITEIAKEKGLARDFGLIHMVWPPVDLEFTNPPRSLVTSPRDRIQLTGTTLLPAGLDLSKVEQIEDAKQAKDNVSALAVPLGGVGAYPTIIAYDSDYRDLLQLAAHEWTHNYLAFRPLGLHYYKNNDLRTINETVADLVGKEIADGVVAKWPLPPKPPPQADSAAQAPAAPTIDVRAELVKLRGEVDALLVQGKIDDAEKLMDDRRDYLAANGYYIRKINQAYFAFNNLYAGAAGSPGAVNPIGPKVDELRRRSGSLAAFLKVIGEVTSVNNLDNALARLTPSVP
jgi:hypothetical protein